MAGPESGFLFLLFLDPEQVVNLMQVKLAVVPGADAAYQRLVDPGKRVPVLGCVSVHTLVIHTQSERVVLFLEG